MKIFKKIIPLITVLVLSQPVFAQNSWRTPLSASNIVGGLVSMCLNNLGQAVPVSDGTCAPLQVAGTFSATLSGFAPGGTYANLSVGASSANVAMPAGTVVVVANNGANTAYVNLGVGNGTVATANNIPIPSNTSVPFTVGSNNYLAAIETAGATSLSLYGGTGLFTGFGGGGGGGSSSNASVGSTGSAVPASGTYIAANVGGNLTGLVATANGLKTDGSAVTQPVSNAGTFAAQLTGATNNINNVSGTVSLPTGAATSALQTTGNTNLSTINTTLGSPFQAGGSIGNSSFGVTQPTAANLNATVVGTGTFATQLTGATNNINNISGIISLPTGAASAANQTNASQKTQIVDSSGNVIASTSNNLNVQCANCSGSGASAADEASFTAGVSVFAPSGVFFQTTPTANALANGQQGMIQGTANRAPFVNLRNASGSEIGVAAAPVQVSVANTGANGTAIAISAASLPLPTGAATSANQPSNSTIGATTAGQTGNVVMGAATTSAPTDTTGNSYPLSLTTAGGLRSDNSSWAGTALGAPSNYGTSPGAVTVPGVNAFITNAPSLGAGAAIIGKIGIDQTTPGTTNAISIAQIGATTANNGAGTATGGGVLRVVAAQDTTTVAGSAPGTAGTPSANVVSIQGVVAGTAVPISGTVSLPAGASTSANQPTNSAQGASTSGQTGNIVMGAATTSAPTDTTGNSYPLSLTTSGGLRGDLSSVNGTALGAPSNYGTSPGAVSVLGVNAFITNAPVLGAGAAIIGKVGIDQTTVGTTNGVSVAQIGAGTVATAATGVQKVGIVGNAGGVFDFVGQNAASSANSVLIGGQFNTTPTTITTGNASPLQLDNAGNLLVNIKAGSSSGAVAQGSTTSGQSGGLTQAAVTTAAPSYTTAQTSPLSLTTSGGLRTDNASWAGTTLGTPSNYGTSPGAVTVPGVNAFVTNTPSVAQSGTWNITNVSGTVSLPTGAATSANQPTNSAQGATTSGQTGTLVQGATTTSAPTYTTAQTNPLSLDVNGNLRVTGAGIAQGSTTSGQTGSGVFGAVTTSAPTYTTAQSNFLSLTTAGGLRVDNASVAGTALGAPSNYGTSPGAVAVSGVNAFITNTPAVSQSGTWNITNVSGTVSLPTGAATSANQPTNSAQGATTSGQTGNLSQAAVTTNAPSYTNAQTSPLSLTTAGALRQDLTSIVGTAADVNSGNKSAGTLRVVIATDQPALTNKLLVTPDSVALPANQSVNLSQVNGATTSTSASGVQKVGIVGNVGATVDFAGQNVASPANSILIGAQFNTTPTTLTTGNSSPLQLDNAGNLLVNIKAGASSGAVAQGSTTSGQTGGLTQAAVTTAAPSYTTAQTSPLSLTTAGGLRIDSASVAGTALGAPSNYGTSPGAVAVSGVNAFITNIPAVSQSGTWNVTNISGTVSLPTGAATSANQPSNSAQGATTSGQTGTMMMGAVTTAAPSYTTAQTSPISLDTSGNIRTNCVAGCSGGSVDEATFTQGTSSFSNVGGFYNTTVTNLTSGQGGAAQLTADRFLKTTMGLTTSTLTGWTSATSQNTTQTLFTNGNTGAQAILLQLDQTSTITGGAITIQGTYDGTNWVTVPANTVLDPTTQNYVQISNPYTLVATTNKPFLILPTGFQSIRINLTSVITGSATVTPYVTLLPYSPVIVNGGAGIVAQSVAPVTATNTATVTVLRPDSPGVITTGPNTAANSVPITIGPTLLGAYCMAAPSGVMAAGLGAAAPIFSFRYGAANLAVVRRVEFSAGDDGTAFAAGNYIFNLFAARSFTASDTGGTASTLTGNNGKLRTSFATTGLSDFRASNTATLTAGTRTLDATALASISGSTPATAGQMVVNPGSTLLSLNIGESPVVLAQNEGLVLQATVPATGTWTFSIKVCWDEVAAF